MESNHEVAFATGAILRRINDLPEAAELALDALRRDPLGEDRERTIAEIVELHQKHGQEASVLYPYFLDIINDNNAFLEIDFDSEVLEAADGDTTQAVIEDELYSRYKGTRGADDITPEFAVSRSRRADMLKWMAAILVNKKNEPKTYASANAISAYSQAEVVALPNTSKTA